MNWHRRSIPKPIAKEIGPDLLGSCAAAAALLLLVQGWPYITPFLHNFEIPPMEWSRLPYTILYSACLWAGLSCISFGGRLATTRKVIVLVVAAYALSALAGAVAFAWIDFAARNVNAALPGPLEHFFDAHQIVHPSGIGLWAALTPGALMAGIALAAASHPWNPRQLLDLESLPFLLQVATAGCAAFLLGSGRAESLYFAVSDLIDAADIGWSVLPVVALGSLGAWLTLKWRRGASAPSRHPSPPRESADIENVLSSAKRTSVLVLVLLYLGISQTSVYANRMAQLVDARKAFASDILYSFFNKGGTLTTTTSSADGKLLASSSVVSGVPWADVNIVQYPGDRRYVVEVTRKPSQEKWSVRQYHQPFDKGIETQQIADQYGVRYQRTDDATKIYPRIDTQLRVADVSFPGAGISLDLTSFVFVIPVILFETLAKNI